MHHLFQFLHVQRLVQVQAGILILSGVWVNEPLQKPLEAKQHDHFQTVSQYSEGKKKSYLGLSYGCNILSFHT